ncbi:hypothetical protein LVB77_20235 [Lysobacter sp. 5GHs7-4]|uniref:hypothetical protein n=1 Tax=Lysobacter sp. 5GHs7-4 TaxID=2904253 RepID=UPI001E5B6834|nr:hypothetical protein [Lysobacter sp. 5GHs7-4]UHQ22946.1 hypothetical protein LVB77_20235 [Lysobacter sp. 5GHs7-4]
MALCRRCEQREAEGGEVQWWLWLPLLLLGAVSGSGYCRDCAGGLNFLGLLATAAWLTIGFVLWVIF